MFKSTSQAQQFLGAHSAASNLFNLGRHLVKAEHYRNLRVKCVRRMEQGSSLNEDADISDFTEINFSVPCSALVLVAIS